MMTWTAPRTTTLATMTRHTTTMITRRNIDVQIYDKCNSVIAVFVEGSAYVS